MYMKITKSKLKEMILEEIASVNFIEEAPEVKEDTIREEIKNLILECLQEGHGLPPLPPTPTREPWQKSSHFEGTIENAVDQLWSNFHGDEYPNQPVAVAERRLDMWKRESFRASERVEQWQEIVSRLKEKGQA